MISARASALAFATTLGFAAVSHAQPAPPPPPSGMAMHHWRRDGAGDPHAMRGAARMRALHDALNIRPDQEAAFQTFAAAVRPPRPEGMGVGERHGQGMDGPERDMSDGPMTAPERADRMVKHFDEHTGRMREALARRAAAVKTFYAVLSPEQRHTFDAVAVLIGRPGGPMGMGHGMGPMGGMPGTGMGPGQPGEAG